MNTRYPVPGSVLFRESAYYGTDIPRLFIAGHSYASGYLNTEGGENWPRRLAAALHAEEVLYAVSGAVLAQDSSSANAGGYANVWNALTPRVASGGFYSPRNSAPYLPLSPVTVFNYGDNDMVYLTAATATNIDWFTMALTACCCIARAGGFFPDTDASNAYSGSWTAQTGQFSYGWPTNHATTSAGASVTISVPADFPGGEIDILTVAVSGGTRWAAAVDGGGSQVLNGLNSAYGSLSGRGNLVVQRITGLSAGAHTIVLTAQAFDSGATGVYGGWLVAAPQLPATVLVNQPLMPGLPLPTGAVHTPLTAGDLTALNAAIAGVAQSFSDGGVVVADIATAFAQAGGNVAYGQPGSLYASDSYHPNMEGHALIAQVVRDQIAAADTPGTARFAPVGLVLRQLNGPLEPFLANGWTAYPGSPCTFSKDRSGNVIFNVNLVNPGSPAVASTIFTLPPGYQPQAPLTFTNGLAWTTGFASASAVAAAVNANGAVTYLVGTPAFQWDLNGSFYADGLGS